MSRTLQDSQKQKRQFRGASVFSKQKTFIENTFEYMDQRPINGQSSR